VTLRFERAIVVGASSGMGAAIARRLAASGAAVALVGRREAALQEVAAAIGREGRGRAIVAPHDVTHHDEVAPQCERLVQELGGLDLLVYAAGVTHPFEEGVYDAARDRDTFDVNVLGALSWCAPVAAHFEARRAGTIIGISSIAGVRGRRSNPSYTASKAALSAWLEALRNRLSRYGVNVVTVKPGYVDTALTRGMKGLFWLVSADDAARMILDVARRGGSPSAYVPARWWLVGSIVRHLPSVVFRRLNF
jgi:short-subunit dehydrogenase